MTISPRTTKMLWGRSSGLCSICRKELVVENTGADAEALIGDMCHMVAESEDGPRGQSALTSEQRDRYENLILLCRNHHAEIDGQPATFPVKRLKTIKAEHEQWVRELWSYDSVQQQDDENCAGYIEEWVRRCDLDGWINWSSFVLGGGQPRIMVEQDRALEELRSWLLGRIWPTRYPTLRRAFANFRAVLEDFQRAFRQQADQPSTDSEWLITQKFYQITEWDEEQYERLHKSYASHVALVSDLMLELTRAANLICGESRKSGMIKERTSTASKKLSA
jgi:hypothetical protein